MLVYLYFQIPLMLIVFLPAVEGFAPSGARRPRPSAGRPGPTGAGSPPRSCSLPRSGAALLFTNAFSAYATAAALVSQASRWSRCRSPARSAPRCCSAGRTSARAMALAMVVIVAIVAAIYAWIDKRASRWMQR